MVTISVEVPTELAEQLIPVKDRLPEIIELGLRQLEKETLQPDKATRLALKQQVLIALESTGIVTIPQPDSLPRSRIRHTPIQAGGPPASEMIIKERREQE